MPHRIPLALPATLLRQIARARPSPRARQVQQLAQFSTFPTQFAAKRPLPLQPSSSAPLPSPTLAALASRLSLPYSPALHPALVACLTHPSFGSDAETNELLASLGNSLLGLFASEHLAARYPYLPTDALKVGVTAYVGPAACFSVARELGVGVHGTSAPDDPDSARAPSPRRRIGSGHGGRPMAEGVPVRWTREVAFEKVPVARRFRGRMEREEGVKYGEHEGAMQKKEGWEDVVAGVVRAFVGLVYQEQGMAAARQFTHAHFLSRYLDMTSLFSFQNPKHVLSRVVAKHLADAGVGEGEGQGKVESRILASTGTNSQSPLFNIGLFLPSGLKLAEGYGSSLKMAEHRAAVNALHALFLVRSDSGSGGGLFGSASGAGGGIPGDRTGAGARIPLPTEAHGTWAVESGHVGRGVAYQGTGWGGKEVIAESSRK